MLMSSSPSPLSQPVFRTGKQGMVDGYICDGIKMLLCAMVNDTRVKVFSFLNSIERNNNTSLILEGFLVIMNGLFSPSMWVKIM